MRTPFIAGNWKMYKTVAETVKYVKEFRALVKDVTGVEIVVAPPFTARPRRGRGGAQQQRRASPRRTCHWEREGAFTGEVSAPMIREAGAEYVIVGHSERRTLFGETDATVNRKVAAAFAAGLTPIVCIGETLDQRERNETFDVLDRQIKQGLDGLTAEQVGAARHRLRAGLGDRHRAQCHARRRRPRRTPTSGSGCASGSGPRRPSSATSSMAAASSPTTSPS